MRYSPPLIDVRFVRRYKRFFADVIFPDGTEQTVFCPNPGSMRSCLGEGWPARVSDSGESSKRKLRYSLEMLHNGRCWIGVNTLRANQLAEEALQSGQIAEFAGYTLAQREVRISDRSRLDFLLRRGRKELFVEVKSVSLCEGGIYLFPDSVTARGRKHMEELRELRRRGAGAAVLFLVQRSDGRKLMPADSIDRRYAQSLREAAAAGVQCLAYGVRLRASGFTLGAATPVDLRPTDRKTN